jgi:SAM-dependent methyltransferase
MNFFDTDKIILEFMEKTNTWSFFYDEIGKLDFLQTMNWGYSNTPDIRKITEYKIPKHNNNSDINSFNLYYYLVNIAIKQTTITISRTADIGCGKGGGINFINRTFGFNTSIGYDFSREGLEKARIHYKNNKRLQFKYLDVRTMSKCAKVDLVTNVESYHCYGNNSKFFKNCYDMLNANGILAMTDFADTNKLNIIGSEASNYFDLLYLEDISPNVILALNQKIRSRDTVNGISKINAMYPQIPGKILDQIAYNFSGEQNKINMQQNKTIYFIAIFKKKHRTNEEITAKSKCIRQYISDNLKENNHTYTYIKNICKLSKPVISELYENEDEIPVTEVICDTKKLKLMEPLATLNYTSPYIMRNYKKLIGLEFNTTCIDYKYQTYTPPHDLIGIQLTNSYNASEFKQKILPNEYIAHEKVPYLNSYATVESNSNDVILKKKMESYYYGMNRGSRLHSDNTNSYIIQLTGKKKWTIYNPVFIPLLKPFLVSAFTSIFFKLATDISNKYIPRYNVVIEEGDLLVVPYGLPHEVMCFDNMISEHINYRGMEDPVRYSKNFPILYENDTRINIIARQYFPDLTFDFLKTIHNNKYIHNLVIPIERTIMDFYSSRDNSVKLYYEHSSVDEIINSI